MAVEETKGKGQRLWYVRKKNKQLGPFPSGTIRRFLLIGRVTIDDQVSHDKKQWKPVSQVPEVVPREVRKAMADGSLDQLLPGRMREDERTGRERRTQSDDVKYAERRKGERREDEEALIKQHRNNRADILKLRESRKRPVTGIVVVGLVVLMGIGFGFYLGSPPAIPDPDCSASPMPGVNWRNCRLDRVVYESANLDGSILSSAIMRDSRLSGSQLNSSDLKYVDLSGADLSYVQMRSTELKGSTMRNANLSYADLSNADLSYSDLSGANLGGANLAQARLDHAIWIDGKTCLPGSVGQCQIAKQ